MSRIQKQNTTDITIYGRSLLGGIGDYIVAKSNTRFCVAACDIIFV